MVIKDIRSALFYYPYVIYKIFDRFPIIQNIFTGFVIAITSFILIFFLNAFKLRENVLREGVVGSVENLFPLIQTNNQLELDIYELIFNSLIKGNTKGEYIPELAESWTISSDGKVYTVFLRKGIKWQDGHKFTSRDVVTTFKLMKEGGNNAKFGNLVQKIEVKSTDEYTVKFILPQSNAAFLQILTVPIVPDHVYGKYKFAEIFEDSLYIYPIGTGPYKLNSIDKHRIVLQKNSIYFKGGPHIDKVVFESNITVEDAKSNLIAGKTDSLSDVLPFYIQELQHQPRLNIKKYTLMYNTKVIFFNLKKKDNILSDKKMRLAVLYAIDRKRIVEDITGAEIAYGPYADNSWAYNELVEKYRYDKIKAQQLLADLGWKQVDNQEYLVKEGRPLILNLSYYDSQINRKVVTDIKDSLKDVGIRLELHKYNRDELLQEVLPNRDFDMLLFEIKTDMDPDQYSLWHSSQAEYPGLNISGYNSKRADWALEQGRITRDRLKREKFYTYFQRALMEDVPVIFLFKPAYFYAYYNYVKIPGVQVLGAPEERFDNIQDWFIKDN